MGLIKWKPNKKLNGKVWTKEDLYNNITLIQRMHIDGAIDVYAPIMRDGIQYPSIADQWKADFARKVKNG